MITVNNTGFRGMGGGTGSNGGWYLFHGRKKKVTHFSNSKFFKKFKEIKEKFTIVEKIFKFTYKNLNVKLIFYPFLSHLPRLLSFYTPLELTKFLGLVWGQLRRAWGSSLAFGGCIPL